LFDGNFLLQFIPGLFGVFPKDSDEEMRSGNSQIYRRFLKSDVVLPYPGTEVLNVILLSALHSHKMYYYCA